MPMPFALSLEITDAKNASDVKTSVSAEPVNNNAMPVASGEYNKIGIPIPIKKEVSSEIQMPLYSLSKILVRLMG